MDYEKLGLKMGLEIHQQLNSQHKLFCHLKQNLLMMNLVNLFREN